MKYIPILVTTLNGDITDSQITLVATDGGVFPYAVSCQFKIDDEEIAMISRSTDTLVISRGANSTTPAAHASGANIFLMLEEETLWAMIRSQNELVNVIGAYYSTTTVEDTATDGHATTAISSNWAYDHNADLTKHTIGREKLTSARTYYIRTDGNDSNTGLVNNSGGAFLKIQKAIDVAAALDCSIYDITIQLGNGTYSVSSTIFCKSLLGSGIVTIIGDETTPSNVIIDSSVSAATGAINATSIAYTIYFLKGFLLKSTAGTLLFGILSSTNSYIKFQNLNFGAGIFQHIRSEDGGKIAATNNYTISGAPGYAHLVSVGGIVRIQSITITISGTPAWAYSFCALSYGCIAIVNNITFSGSATGKRYDVTMNGICFVNGGGANYFPGDGAGTAGTGGQYA